MSDLLHLDDFQPGQIIELGNCHFSEEDIVGFARQFDPQPFHVDPEAGLASPYRGLIASGWHTASALMRVLVDNVLNRSAALGSPGVDQLRWLLPVRPGDTLALRKIVREVKTGSRPDRGTVISDCEVRNQRGELVMTVVTMLMFRRRPAALAQAA